MKTTLKITACLLLALSLFAFNADNKVILFNGENLDNWNIFVSTSEVDPAELFYVEDGVINTLGVPHGVNGK